ncbi:MAG: hypothetical protein ACR2NZ_12495, partial [Rubripirellula sp.]
MGEGDYEVQMFYACKADAVGSKLSLTLGDQKIEKTIEVAHDVPLIGREEDHFQRVEGYVRDWRPMNLGVIKMVPGMATLTLAATEVTGQQVADMRLLLFRRIDQTN